MLHFVPETSSIWIQGSDQDSKGPMYLNPFNDSEGLGRSRYCVSGIVKYRSKELQPLQL